MWLISPVLILLFASLGILILQRIRPRLGYSWIIAIVASLAVWVLLLIMHWVTPMPLNLPGWSWSRALPDVISFEVDLISWPYAFALSSLLLAVIMTSATRLQGSSNPMAWAGCLLITGLGILAVWGRTALTLLLVWTLLDLIELGVLISSVQNNQSIRQALLSFAVKTAGSFVVIYSMFQSASQGLALEFDQVPAGIGIFLLVAAGLRLGVIPRHLPLS